MTSSSRRRKHTGEKDHRQGERFAGAAITGVQHHKRPGDAEEAEAITMIGGFMRKMLIGVLCCAASPAMAQKSVLTLGAGRGYDVTTTTGDVYEFVMTGRNMQTIRSILVGDGFTFTAGESFTATNLTGFDIVFLGMFDPSQALSATEQAALENFVRSGGALIYLGDNDRFASANGSAGGMFGVSFQVDANATSASDIPDTLHPIIRGPYGTVGTYDASLNRPGFFGGISQLGSDARAVLGTGSRTTVAAIAPDALGSGSGPVVLIAEANGFMDAGAGTIDQADNITLMRNIFAYAARQAAPCSNDADCDDSLFCNGVETCVAGVCERGVFPCDSGLGCKEASDTCGPCAADSECDNHLFCDGVETCDAGTCIPGVRPCAPTDGCDEDVDTCGPCANDAQCDDSLHCNGVETCAPDGTCLAGTEPCLGACDTCDEATQACVGCLLDIDHDSFIGTGDFGFFAGCFGACYPDGDSCLITNFDDSADGCIGTGDFAPFSGCFGASCTECNNCERPGPDALQVVAAGLASATVELVAVASPTPVDEVDALPASAQSFEVGQVFYIEVWATRPAVFDDGLASVYVSLNVDTALIQPLKLGATDLFSTFRLAQGAETSGLEIVVGGAAGPGESRIGLAPQWARVAVMAVQFTQPGATTIRSSGVDDTYGIAAFGRFGNISPLDILFGQFELVSFQSLDQAGFGGMTPPRSQNVVGDILHDGGND